MNSMKKLVIIIMLALGTHAFGQEQANEAGAEQDRASMAVDATATQWSFQLAYQSMPDYHDDIKREYPGCLVFD